MSFWTGSLSKSVKTCDDESTLAKRFFTMDPKRVNVASSNSKQFWKVHQLFDNTAHL